jgi:hypothetical protein
MRTHQQDTEAVETTGEGIQSPHRGPTLNTAQPDPLGSHPFARIIRPRSLARPESLYKKGLRKVGLLIYMLTLSLIASSLDDLGPAGDLENRSNDVEDGSACCGKGLVQGFLRSSAKRTAVSQKLESSSTFTLGVKIHEHS